MDTRTMARIAYKLTGIDEDAVSLALTAEKARGEGNTFGAEELEKQVKNPTAFFVAREIVSTLVEEEDRLAKAFEERSGYADIEWRIEEEIWDVEEI